MPISPATATRPSPDAATVGSRLCAGACARNRRFSPAAKMTIRHGQHRHVWKTRICGTSSASRSTIFTALPSAQSCSGVDLHAGDDPGLAEQVRAETGQRPSAAGAGIRGGDDVVPQVDRGGGAHSVSSATRAPSPPSDRAAPGPGAARSGCRGRTRPPEVPGTRDAGPDLAGSFRDQRCGRQTTSAEVSPNADRSGRRPARIEHHVTGRPGGEDPAADARPRPAPRPARRSARPPGRAAPPPGARARGSP